MVHGDHRANPNWMVGTQCDSWRLGGGGGGGASWPYRNNRDSPGLRRIQLLLTTMNVCCCDWLVPWSTASDGGTSFFLSEPSCLKIMLSYRTTDWLA